MMKKTFDGAFVLWWEAFYSHLSVDLEHVIDLFEYCTFDEVELEVDLLDRAVVVQGLYKSKAWVSSEFVVREV